jgi:hypothetical protein
VACYIEGEAARDWLGGEGRGSVVLRGRQPLDREGDGIPGARRRRNFLGLAREFGKSE